jgi:hypothetical protein
MSALVTVKGLEVEVPDVDRLRVEGELVELQQATADGYRTVAVVGEKLLVRLEAPSDGKAVEVAGPLWRPVGEPAEAYGAPAAAEDPAA